MCEFVPRQFKAAKSPWGKDDQIGRLNWITDESVEELMSSLDYSSRYDLTVDYFMGMPSWVEAGDPPFQIWMTHTPDGNKNDNLTGASKETLNKFSYSGDAISMYTHCGTHIDTFSHYGYDGFIWNKYSVEENLGSRHWNKCGPENYPSIISRAILLDIAKLKNTDVLPPSYGIGKQDIIDAMEAQEVSVKKGDIVLLRTGRMNYWPNHEKYSFQSPGLNIEGAEYLSELGAMIVGADNIGLEQTPPDEEGSYFPVHTYLLAEAGIPIIEVLNLEELSKKEIYTMGFIAKAMPIKGATGAPLQPIVFNMK